MNKFYLAVKNKLAEESAYHSDLFDLFGTPDGYEEGYLGIKDGNEMKSINWGWGINGLKKIMKFIFITKLDSDLIDFEKWYEDEKNNDFKNSIKYLDELIYVFDYNRKKMTAFIADINNLEKRGRKIYIDFTPKKYMILPPEFNNYYRDNLFNQKGFEDFYLWDKYLNLSKKEIESLNEHPSTLDQYHFIPKKIITDWLETKYINNNIKKPVYISPIIDNKKRKKNNLQTNNQIFWNLLSDYIGKTQVKGNYTLNYNGEIYSVTNIPVNSIIDKGLVYIHEVGIPKIISLALCRIFGKKYIIKEFDNSFKISIDESKFIKRAVKVKELVDDQNKWGNTDYDYLVDLNELGINKKIVFDLTNGLWHKGGGLGKSKKDYVKQWTNNIFDISSNKSNIISIWHYGLKEFEEFDGNKEVAEYIIDNNQKKYNAEIILKNNKDNYKISNKDTFILPFYNGKNEYMNFENEFNNLDPRKDQYNKNNETQIYDLLCNLFKKLK
ncbi:MAG: hypothetical protein ACOCP8_07965 [archaeon]